jgi:hypothetical protein
MKQSENAPRTNIGMRALVGVVKRLPPSLQEPLISLRASRFNFGMKMATLRRYDVGFRKHPLLATKYVLLDPEIDNFTYDLANESELAHFLSETLDRSPKEIRGYMAEIANDLELSRSLRRRLRRRWDRKHTPPLRSPGRLVRHRQGPQAEGRRRDRHP